MPKWLLAYPRVPDTINTTHTNIFCGAALEATAERQPTFSLKSVDCLFLLCFPASLLKLFFQTCGIALNSGPIFPSFVCANNVIKEARSAQCFTVLKKVHLGSTFSKFNFHSKSYPWSCSPRCILSILGFLFLLTLCLLFWGSPSRIPPLVYVMFTHNLFSIQCVTSSLLTYADVIGVK